MNSQWIGVDWGTSNLRAWSFDGDNNVIAQARAASGMTRVNGSEFETVLLQMTENWLPQSGRIDVIVSGMAGARHGWAEAPYLAAPCAPFAPEKSVSPQVSDLRIGVTILPGVRTTSPSIDVIRGEETQIAGYLCREPDFDGIICLPGTHTKWVHVTNGLIVSFRTFMSGELFDLLTNQSSLSCCIAKAGHNPEAFQEAVETSMSHPTSLVARLFGIRAESLLEGLSPADARSRLSGLLVGAELASCKPFWLGRRTVVIGETKIAEAYALSLEMQKVETEILDASDATIAGLRAFRKQTTVEATQ